MIALLDKDILYKHYMLVIESIQMEFDLTTEEATKYFEMNRDYGIQVRQNARLEVAKKRKERENELKKKHRYSRLYKDKS